MTDQDAAPLLCAWCGEPLSAVECTIIESSKEWIGWHPECVERDSQVYTMWWRRRAIIEARGPGRVGKIQEVER